MVFTRGCNFRCSYCHNPELVDPSRYSDTIDPEPIIRFLEKRSGKLDGLTITGGEPTLQDGLLPFMERVKKMNYKIKLDTNGAEPEVLRNVLDRKLAYYIAMDIKAPLESYSQISGVPVELSAIEESISLIRTSGISYQFRTTLVPSLHTGKMREEIEKWMTDLKAEHIFQDFIPGKTLNTSLQLLENSNSKDPDKFNNASLLNLSYI